MVSVKPCYSGEYVGQRRSGEQPGKPLGGQPFSVRGRGFSFAEALAERVVSGVPVAE
jgi:hypothetical protein